MTIGYESVNLEKELELLSWNSHDIKRSTASESAHPNLSFSLDIYCLNGTYKARVNLLEDLVASKRIITKLIKRKETLYFFDNGGVVRADNETEVISLTANVRPSDRVKLESSITLGV
ncbi:MAG: hypothetical protein AABX30_02270 [Nanoarchaeota archaeon]